tara:strand:+ start:615 stop:1154 length:540 start_codon:yes stop_codon:yes gene_type:complete
MINNGGYPVNKYSQGITCSQTSLAITPFITQGRNFATPWYGQTHQNIYNSQTNEDGSLMYPGKIDYVNTQNRYQQDTHTFNYGITASISVPLDNRFQNACLRAVNTNIEAQQLLITQTKLSIELNRLKICAEQARTGATFVGEFAVSCQGIKVEKVIEKTNPHTHSISVNPSVLSSSEK